MLELKSKLARIVGLHCTVTIVSASEFVNYAQPFDHSGMLRNGMSARGPSTRGNIQFETAATGECERQRNPSSKYVRPKCVNAMQCGAHALRRFDLMPSFAHMRGRNDTSRRENINCVLWLGASVWCMDVEGEQQKNKMPVRIV